MAQEEDSAAITPVKHKQVRPKQVQVDTSTRQFPVVRRSRYVRRRSKRRSKGAALDAKWGPWLLDRLKLEFMEKNASRVRGSKNRPCFTYDEMVNYEKNQYYRSALLAGVVGVSVYLVLLLFLILPKIDPQYSEFMNENAFAYATMVMGAVVLCFVVRYGLFRFANAYYVAIFQLFLVLLSIYGNIEFDCDQKLNNSTLSGAGHLPLFIISAPEASLGLRRDNLTRSLHQFRCENALKRLGAVNMLGEMLGFFISLRLCLL